MGLQPHRHLCCLFCLLLARDQSLGKGWGWAVPASGSIRAGCWRTDGLIAGMEALECGQGHTQSGNLSAATVPGPPSPAHLCVCVSVSVCWVGRGPGPVALAGCGCSPDRDHPVTLSPAVHPHQVARSRSGKTFTTGPRESLEEQLKPMIDWAITGFKPLGLKGLQPPKGSGEVVASAG